MKKLLALMLLAVFMLSMPACQSASDSPNPPETIDSATTVSTTTQQPTVTTTEPTVTTTEPTVTTTEPTVTQPTKPTADSVIHYNNIMMNGIPDSSPIEGDMSDTIDVLNELQKAAAICLITVTDIEPSWDIDKYGEQLRGYQLTPIHMRIDEIYLSTDYFEFQESDEMVAIDLCDWVDHGDDSYTVSYRLSIPLTAIGDQYVVYMCYDTIINEIYVDIVDGQEVLIETYKDYFVQALTIPINENIDDEEYRNEWHEKMELSSETINASNQFIDDFYKSENGEENG